MSFSGRGAGGWRSARPGETHRSDVAAALFGVIFFGRLIMYNDTLLYALGL